MVCDLKFPVTMQILSVHKGAAYLQPSLDLGRVADSLQEAPSLNQAHTMLALLFASNYSR